MLILHFLLEQRLWSKLMTFGAQRNYLQNPALPLPMTLSDGNRVLKPQVHLSSDVSCAENRHPAPREEGAGEVQQGLRVFSCPCAILCMVSGIDLSGVAREWRKDRHMAIQKSWDQWTGLSVGGVAAPGKLGVFIIYMCSWTGRHSYYVQINKGWGYYTQMKKEASSAHLGRRSLYRGAVFRL